MDLLKYVEDRQKKKLPSFKTGDTVKVYIKIKEGGKDRIQAFEGIVIRKKRGSIRSSFTVRKVSYGVGVERIFPLYSPFIDRIEVIQAGNVRRSRLYYLRKLTGKAARIREEKYTIEGEGNEGVETGEAVKVEPSPKQELKETKETKETPQSNEKTI